MRAGRRPKPTRLKLIQGNPGRRPLNLHEPQPEPALPACPVELAEAAQAEWRRVADELHTLGLLTRLDRAALAAYCQAWGEWLEAVAAVRRAGPVVKAPSGYPMLNPHLTVASQAFARIKAMLVEFGMSPAARARVVARSMEDEDDEAARFFGGIS
jgi:P27 family predicted phage terminase small subunit